MAAILEYTPFKDKLGSVALKCGQVFGKLFPGEFSTHDIDNALATFVEIEELLEELGGKLIQARKWAENLEKKEHLTS